MNRACKVVTGDARVEVDRPDAEAILGAAEAATRKIAPLWPLQSFVAVNPYLGHAGRDFGETADVLARAGGARLTMPREFYAEALADGRIAEVDLEAALAGASPGFGLPRDAAELARSCAGPGWSPSRDRLPTVADAAAALTGSDWPRLVVDRISFWAAAHFDQGQSLWRSPWRDHPPFEAWRAEAVVDRTPEVMGLAGFRTSVKALPASAAATIEAAVRHLGVPADALETYLHRLLMTIGGWAAYARGLQWNAELRGERDGAVAELLAVRLAWEVALLQGIPGLEGAWADVRNAYVEPRRGRDPELALDLILHDAYERAAQRRLLESLAGASATPVRTQRPHVQAAFCIDVRSEVVRRHLEAQAPGIETIGFAGFFGVAVEFVPFGHEHGGAHCPVLLAPRYRVEEHLEDVSAGQAQQWSRRHEQRWGFARAWKSFKLGAVASFGFVETIGLGYAAKLIGDSLGLTRPVPHPRRFGHAPRATEHLAPRLEFEQRSGLDSGIPHEHRADLAEAILRGMSLTSDFARLVLLVGHGATTVNNPHATGLDCGACGGHGGDDNARIAARLLNDRSVREALRGRGIVVPEDTVFLPCRHDTTTDVLVVLERAQVPASHAGDLKDLEAWFSAAGGRAREERSRRLDLPVGVPVDEAIQARSRDWSQVRPEWGLAGCRAFIVAPRHRTAGVDLCGRVFLHSYDWHRDRDFAGLEQIMTAPMIVASWITLQYFASTVDNTVFGAGNKVLHNVAGALGVLEGNGGDLRVGLPLQSVHDGTRWVHEPVRLSVIIEAPVRAINEVIRKHAAVRELADNGWIHLFAMDEGGTVAHRYAGMLRWDSIDDGWRRVGRDSEQPLQPDRAASSN